jgi:uncharacterized protein (TIGR02421 family)
MKQEAGSMELSEIDIVISKTERDMDFYSCLRPLNQEEERKNFFDNLRQKRSYDPVFEYRKTDTRKFRAGLEAARKCLYKGVVEELLGKKLEFILAEMDLLTGGDDAFGRTSAWLYGVPGEECLRLSRDILASSREEKYVFPEETVPPAEMASTIRDTLKEKGINWNCVLSKKIIPKITVSPRDRTVYVNSAINYTEGEIARLKTHEVEVHVYRGVNGERQPFRIFAEGLAGYDETEEGLAMEVERLTGALETDTRQMKLYAGRALCAEISMKSGFYETFSLIREYFPDEIAYRITERAKRGLSDTSKKGALNKAFHYISGWLKVRNYVEHGGDLSILYLGKIGLDDVDAVKHLLVAGVLKRPEYLPSVLKQQNKRG